VHSFDIQDFDASEEQAVETILKSNSYDVVIHAAVYNPRVVQSNCPDNELDKNLRMFFNFERFRDLYGKMLYFGSGAEFDKNGNIRSVKENSTGNGIPKSDYGFYKYVINKSIRCSDNFINLRLFGLFGKYENWKNTFISGACCKALKGLPITIRQNVYFDYLYISDFCRIIKWFLDNESKHGEYNIASGDRIDLVTLAEIVLKVSRKQVPVYICREGFGNEYTASNKRLMSEVNNFTFTPMEEAVNDLYTWYQDHEEDIDTYSLLYQ